MIKVSGKRISGFTPAGYPAKSKSKIKMNPYILNGYTWG